MSPKMADREWTHQRRTGVCIAAFLAETITTPLLAHSIEVTLAEDNLNEGITHNQ